MTQLVDSQRVTPHDGGLEEPLLRPEGGGGLVMIDRVEHDNGAGRTLTEFPVVDGGHDSDHRVPAEGGVVGHVRDRAAEKLGVNSTPTFFVNGKKFNGDQSIEALAKEIDPYLKEG